MYFNLANGIDIKKVILSMDSELKTNLYDNIKGQSLKLYIDSFDEGLGIESKREVLI